MNSIRRKLTRTLVAAILVLAAAGLGAVYLSARFAVIDQFDVALAAKAQAIETLTTAMPGGAEVGFTDRYFRGFDNYRPEDFFEIWDDAGHSLARSESLRDAHLTERAGLTPRAKFYTMPLPDGKAGRAMALTFVPKPIKGPTPALPIFHLVVVSDRDHLDDNLELLASLAAGCAVALIGVTAARAIFWAIPTRFLTGVAAAGGLAFINSIGTVGGFVGPSMMGWLREFSGSYIIGLTAVAAIMIAATVASMSLKLVGSKE